MLVDKTVASCGILLRDMIPPLNPPWLRSQMTRSLKTGRRRNSRTRCCWTRWMEWECSCKDPRCCCHDKTISWISCL